MSKKYIRLSEKYGVNPTIPICFFCGKEKNEVALLGKIGKKGEDIQAPMHCLLDYQPCNECKSQMNMGVTLIEVTTKQPADNRPPIQENKNTGAKAYPTGKWSVMKEDAVSRIFPPEFAESAIQTGKLLLNDAVYEQLLSNANNTDK